MFKGWHYIFYPTNHAYNFKSWKSSTSVRSNFKQDLSILGDYLLEQQKVKTVARAWSCNQALLVGILTVLASFASLACLASTLAVTISITTDFICIPTVTFEQTSWTKIPWLAAWTTSNDRLSGTGHIRWLNLPRISYAIVCAVFGHALQLSEEGEGGLMGSVRPIFGAISKTMIFNRWNSNIYSGPLSGIFLFVTIDAETNFCRFKGFIHILQTKELSPT